MKEKVDATMTTTQANIYIVWSRHDFLPMFASFFREMGYFPVTMLTLEEGFVRCIHKPPDVLLIGCSMSQIVFSENTEEWIDRDGLELGQRLRRQQNLHTFPIVVGDADLGYEDGEGYRYAFSQGANACFGRIFNIELIGNMVDRLLQDPTLTNLSDRAHVPKTCGGR